MRTGRGESLAHRVMFLHTIAYFSYSHSVLEGGGGEERRAENWKALVYLKDASIYHREGLTRSGCELKILKSGGRHVYSHKSSTPSHGQVIFLFCETKPYM